MGFAALVNILNAKIASPRCSIAASTSELLCLFHSRIASPIKEKKMAIANGTCVSFCNQTKAQPHNLATSGESRRYVVAFTRFAGGGIWLPQESLRHILASPGYAPVTHCYMDEKRIQCLSNALQHVPIYLQPFPSNSTRKFKSSPY